MLEWLHKLGDIEASEVSEVFLEKNPSWELFHENQCKMCTTFSDAITKVKFDFREFFLNCSKEIRLEIFVSNAIDEIFENLKLIGKKS